MKRVAVVGASLAGLEAARTLRELGFTGELVIFGREAEPPYDRPPLSKELLRGTYTAEDIRLSLGAAADADWRIGRTVTALDATARTLSVDGGRPESYDGIIIATGATPIRPRLAGEAGHVLRTLSDSLALAEDLRRAPGRVVIIGAGFIGAEVASTARSLGLPVTVVEGLDTPLRPALGPEVGAAMGRLQRDHGVDLRTGVTVVGVDGDSVQLSDDTVVAADVVVAAVGVRPATGWLAGSGLTLDGGVVCDAAGRAAPGIVAAGDVARWPLGRYGSHRRVEHWDSALRQARHAAHTLLVGPSVFDPVPWFWSDQFGRKLQLLGLTDGYEEVQVVAGSLTDDRFLALYRRGGQLTAVAALNHARGIIAGRALLDRGADWATALSTFDSALERIRS